MKIEFLSEHSIECTDDFKKRCASFKIEEQELELLQFPSFIKVTGSYSNHFDWSVWKEWKALPEKPYLSDGQGALEDGRWVESAKEAALNLRYKSTPPFREINILSYENITCYFLSVF